MDANWWNNALQSYDVGRQHRADRENAEAFQTGGYDAVEQTAGARGDLRTAMTTRRFQDDRQNQAYEWFEQNAPYARNVLRRARAIQDPQQRATFLQSQRQRFEGIGFQPEQIDSAIQNLTNPETAEEAFASYDAAFTQHQDPNWQLNQGTGQVYAVDPNTGAVQEGGRVDIAPDWQTNGTVPYRITPDGQVVQGSGSIPHRPNQYGMGGEGYSVVDAAEVESMGLPPGSYQRNNATGQITVLGRQRGQYTESASLSAQFADRTASANQTLTALEDQFGSPEGVWVARAGFGNQYERQARQAQREFVNAILRRESGAAISPTEFASAQQQYFPQPGDGPAVIEQKRAARERAVQGLINASQGAYDEWYGTGSGAEPPPAGPGAGSTMGAIVGARGAPRAVLERPNEIPANEWAAMTPEERSRVIQILGRQGAQ